MTRRLVVVAMIALSGCGMLPAASPREIEDLTVTFTPSEPGRDAISREQAIQGAREWGPPGMRHQLAAVPDVAEFGMAVCQDHEPQCLGPRGGPRPVWLVEWTPAPDGRDFGTLLVDGLTGEVVIGFTSSP